MRGSAPSRFDPLWTRVADPLRQAIVEGALRPGEPLSENRLASEYGVSRTPVREALRLLMEEGLVEMLPGRKVRVAVPRAADVREVYDIRCVLESEAVRRLLQGTTSSAAPILQAMGCCCDQADAALAQHDLGALARANERFHAALIGALRNGRLIAQYGNVHNLISLYRHQSLQTQAWAEAGTAEHRELLKLLTDRDQNAAITLLHAHIAHACEVVCRRFATTDTEIHAA
jgi:DNA-binding GntR family transcriptional regulator